ncbi:MAG: hypothetical protein U0931_35240 [Vulcanimicrobiota bacterium]
MEPLVVMFILVMTASASLHLDMPKSSRKDEFHTTPLRPRKAA